MLKKTLLTCLLILIVICVTTNVFALSLNNIINQGTNFADKGNSAGIGSTLASMLKTSIIPMIGSIGNLVFAAVTVILGTKYIWSSAEGRADVMESLPSFVIAVIFFYLAGSVYSFASGATSQIVSAKNWTSLSNYIIYIINMVIQYVAFGGIIFMGVKYMLAGAEGKASIKTSMGGMFIGMLFVFMTTKVIQFIVSAGGYII